MKKVLLEEKYLHSLFKPQNIMSSIQMRKFRPNILTIQDYLIEREL